ncbi:MAG TPA: hypothetical protein VGD67_26790 [Pseudonocardiaceae bacterium]
MTTGQHHHDNPPDSPPPTDRQTLADHVAREVSGKVHELITRGPGGSEL